METVKLKFPTKLGEAEITEVQIRRPKGIDMREMTSKKPHEQDFWLLSRVMQKPMDFIDDMDGEDIAKCMEVMRGFLSLGR